MPIKTYQGSCQCRRVKFEASLDLGAGTSKCNCTSCWKRRWWSARVQPSDFKMQAGLEALSGYKPGAEKAGGFCTSCGVRTFVWVDAAEWNDGEYVSINVAALDAVPPEELLAAPVQYCDGLNDNWWHAPAETRHL